MSESLVAGEALFDEPLPTVAAAPAFELAPDQIDPVSVHQAALAMLGQRSITTTDVEQLALGAARIVARICHTDAYGVAQRTAAGDRFLMRFGRLDAQGSSQPVRVDELPVTAGRSLVAFAVASARPVAVNDLSQETRFSDPWLVKEGVVSALACPLVHPRGPLGALCICSTNRCEFSSADTHFVESVAHLLAISFARQSAEQLVLQQSRRLDALVKSSETPMVEMTAQARITHCNPALEQLTQFHRSQLEGRSFFSAFVLPEELREVQRVLNGVRDGQDGGRVEFFLLTKTGFRRRMAWSFRRVAGEDGTASAIVGTGVDITDQYEMVHRLQRAEAMTEHAVQSLRVLTSKASRGELGATASAPRTDRRSKKRRSFPIKQCIAPIVGGSMPAPDLYREVDCHDLSCSGFSYRSNGIPDYQKIVVALGKQGGIIHVIAEVVHVTPLLNPGEELYLVGCRYIGRAGADQIENDTPRS